MNACPPAETGGDGWMDACPPAETGGDDWVGSCPTRKKVYLCEVFEKATRFVYPNEAEMITYLKGAITHKSPTYIVVEAGGVGYHVNISLYTYARIEKLETIKILTHLHIKEDSHTLYGFADAAERRLFVLLISVSGVGPSTAQLLLSSLSPEELQAAIVGEDVGAFKQVKGIGPKTAKRIILDLKDKVVRESIDMPASFSAADNTIRDEALSALVALGFSKIQAQKALKKALAEHPTTANVEGLVKSALKQLS